MPQYAICLLRLPNTTVVPFAYASTAAATTTAAAAAAAAAAAQSRNAHAVCATPLGNASSPIARCIKSNHPWVGWGKWKELLLPSVFCVRVFSLSSEAGTPFSLNPKP